MSSLGLDIWRTHKDILNATIMTDTPAALPIPIAPARFPPVRQGTPRAADPATALEGRLGKVANDPGGENGVVRHGLGGTDQLAERPSAALVARIGGLPAPRQAKAPQAYGFDVFDTAITRPWFRPADLFYAVATELRHHGLWTRDEASFRDQRIAAEQQARQATARDEVTLAEIYRAMAAAAGWTDAQRCHAEALERTVELESTVPIACTRAAALAIVARGMTLLFISDTYFDGGTVGRMLAQAGFPVDAARLFVSSATGATKWSGRLFRDVLRELGIPPRRLDFTGDNSESDLRIPGRMGIRAHRFREGLPNRYETMFAGLAGLPAPLASAIAGSARAARLARHAAQARSRTVWATSADVSGPLLAGYVLWLLGRAVARGRRRLYFFARDGQIIKRIAEHFVAWYGLDIELRYLYVSRRALFLAALDAVDDDALDWMVEDGEGKTLANILARVDLDYGQVAGTLARLQHPLAPSTRLTREDLVVLAKVFADAAVAPAIVDAGRQRRELVIAYARQEGMLDGTAFAIVDIGWRGRLQRALHTMLVGGGLLEDAAMVGFYLGMFTRVADMPWGVLETCLPDGTSYHAALLEFFTAADHASTLGYRRLAGRIEPMLDSAAEDAAKLADVRLQQQAILAFVANLLRALRRPTVTPAQLAQAVMAAGLAAVDRLIQAPSREEAEVFGGLRHSSDQAHLDAHAIAPLVGLGAILPAACGYLRPLRQLSHWPEASVRRSVRNPAVSSVVLALLNLRRRAAALARRAGAA
jgi:FMN phosphatase YigB (HAD superfamily)